MSHGPVGVLRARIATLHKITWLALLQVDRDMTIAKLRRQVKRLNFEAKQAEQHAEEGAVWPAAQQQRPMVLQPSQVYCQKPCHTLIQHPKQTPFVSKEAQLVSKVA